MKFERMLGQCVGTNLWAFAGLASQARVVVCAKALMASCLAAAG